MFDGPCAASAAAECDFLVRNPLAIFCMCVAAMRCCLPLSTAICMARSASRPMIIFSAD